MPERSGVHPDLQRDLTELGRSLPVPGDPALTTAVMARVGTTTRRPARFAGHRVAVAAVIAVLVALLATPPVRAAIADWFGFGAVVVRTGDGEPSGPPPTPPTIGPGLSPADAAERVDFEVFRLRGLGDPAAAEVSADRRVLSLDWNGGPRLDQSSSLTYTFAKSARSVERVSVDGRDALWFADSHEVVLLDESGATVPQTDRRAGRTLVWMVGDTTLRLEGDLTLARALSLAESAEPLG